MFSVPFQWSLSPHSVTPRNTRTLTDLLAPVTEFVERHDAVLVGVHQLEQSLDTRFRVSIFSTSDRDDGCTRGRRRHTQCSQGRCAGRSRLLTHERVDGRHDRQQLLLRNKATAIHVVQREDPSQLLLHGSS